jgi:hypothetical protein
MVYGIRYTVYGIWYTVPDRNYIKSIDPES